MRVSDKEPKKKWLGIKNEAHIWNKVPNLYALGVWRYDYHLINACSRKGGQ